MKKSLTNKLLLTIAVVIVWLLYSSFAIGAVIINDSTVSHDSSVQLNKKFELTTSFIPSYTNPYDPDEISFSCQFISPSGKTYTQYGFYITSMTQVTTRPDNLSPGSSSWKIRFSPNEVGTWQFRLSAVDDNGYDTYPSSGYDTFYCSDNSNNNGPVDVADKKYLRHRKGDYFFPISSNYPWYLGKLGEGNLYNGVAEMTDSMEILSDLGVDLIRLYISTSSSLGIISYDEFEAGYFLNYMDQRDSWRLDKIFEYAEEINMYLTLSLLDHKQFVDGWFYQKNPFYSSTPKSPVNVNDNPGDCFDHEYFVRTTLCDESLQSVKNYFRYVVARWGYSNNLFAYETYNEPDNNTTYNASYIDYLSIWQQQVYNYLKSIDPYDRLVTLCLTKLADYDKLDDYVDYIQAHPYMDYVDNRSELKDQKQIDHIRSKMALIDSYDKPVHIAEYGHINDDTGYVFLDKDPYLYDVHCVNWASLFIGGMTNASFWHWRPFFELYDPDTSVFKDYYYNPIKNYKESIPDWNETYESKYLDDNGIDVYYLESEDKTTYYGYMQDQHFSFMYLYNKGYEDYIQTLAPSERPPYASASSPYYTINLPVGFTSKKYELKRFYTTSGDSFPTQISTNSNYEVPIVLSSSLRGGVFADCAFSVSCKPSIGWVERLTCPRQWNSAISVSELVVDNQGDDIFFVNTLKDVCHLYSSGGNVWSDGRISNSGDEAYTGRNLVFNKGDGSVCYVEGNRKIYNSYFSGGSWTSNQLCSSQSNYVGSYSKLTMNDSGTELFYVDINGNVCRLYKSGSNWYDSKLNSSQMKSTYRGRALMINPYDDCLYYVGTDYKIYRFSQSYGVWTSQKVTTSQSYNVRYDSELQRNVTGADIFYHCYPTKS